MGGMVKAIELGYPQKEIAEASYQYQRAAEAKEKVIVGVNDFMVEEDAPHILYIDESVARQQSAKLQALRARRSNDEVRRCLDALKKSAAQEPKAGREESTSAANTMPHIIGAGARLRHCGRDLRRPAWTCMGHIQKSALHSGTMMRAIP